MAEGIDLGDGFGPFFPDTLSGTDDFNIIILEKEQLPGGDAVRQKAKEEYRSSIKKDHEAELKDEKKALQKQLSKIKTQTRVASVRRAIHKQREQLKARIALIDDEIADIHTVKARNNPQKYFGKPPPDGSGKSRKARPDEPDPDLDASPTAPQPDPASLGDVYGLMRHFN